MDLEYTFINGTYSAAGLTDATAANKTKGMLEAITTNVIDVGSSQTAAALTYWKVAEALKVLREQGADTSEIVLGVSPVAALQLNKDASENQYLQGIVTVAGLNLTEVVTPLGKVRVAMIDSLAPAANATSNTAILFNPAEIHPVYQPVPGKGNFFLEELAKTGAADKYMIFGQAGLDFGAEFHSAKLRYISNSMPTGTL